MAYDSGTMVSGLCVHTVRRQSSRYFEDCAESDGGVVSDWDLAWNFGQFPDLGHDAMLLYHHRKGAVPNSASESAAGFAQAVSVDRDSGDLDVFCDSGSEPTADLSWQNVWNSRRHQCKRPGLVSRTVGLLVAVTSLFRILYTGGQKGISEDKGFSCGTDFAGIFILAMCVQASVRGE